MEESVSDVKERKSEGAVSISFKNFLVEVGGPEWPEMCCLLDRIGYRREVSQNTCTKFTLFSYEWSSLKYGLSMHFWASRAKSGASTNSDCFWRHQANLLLRIIFANRPAVALTTCPAYLDLNFKFVHSCTIQHSFTRAYEYIYVLQVYNLIFQMLLGTFRASPHCSSRRNRSQLNQCGHFDGSQVHISANACRRNDSKTLTAPLVCLTCT